MNPGKVEDLFLIKSRGMIIGKLHAAINKQINKHMNLNFGYMKTDDSTINYDVIGILHPEIISFRFA